jgi:hypothetical protein
MPTVAIPVEELLARVRAERVGSPGAPPPLRSGQPAQHRRSEDDPDDRPSGARPRPGADLDPMPDRMSDPDRMSEPDRMPEPRSRPRASRIVVRARDEGRGTGSGTDGGGSGRSGRGGIVSSTSTLWLLAAIVVLFAAAVVLLAITVRSLCLTTALPT